MGSVPRPPPASHAATLSSLTNEPFEEPTSIPHITFARDQEQVRPQDIRTSVHNGWVMARNSRIPSRVWNRQSILVFADFNNFESPRGSRSQRIAEHDDEDLEDTSSRPDYVRSSASSSYSLDKALPEPPYHVFTLAKKKQLVYIVSLAGLFSPLSSNIYFPALGQIATDLKTSISLVSLTITVYMVVQGLAPSFWGPLSDTQGRRITFIGTFTVYLLANVGLGFSNSFATLMVFRGIQAAGSAATISVGAGVIGDITTSRERGGLIGVFGGIRMMGQSIGPVFGGIITQFLGFRSIFWFLFGLGFIALLLILLLLPETLRSIAGNGTLRLAGIHRPLIYTFSPPSDALIDHDPTPKRKLALSGIVAPLKFLFEKDVFITLFFGSIVYTVWSMVTSSTTSLFQSRFHLSDLQIGLAFLPNGAGCVAGSYLTGYLMDHDYRVIESQYRTSKNIPEDTKLNKKDLVDFPIEKSRLRNIWWIVLIFIVATAGYGFSLNINFIALPLILQFFIAYTATAVFSLNSALVIDLYPGASASATAVNNLMRCSVGAVGVAVVQIVINGVGAGIAFLGFAVVTAGASPLLVLEWFYGEGWRWERRERLKAEEEKKIGNVENAEVVTGK
ncbi:related to synaptic vesicle transporter SVOP and related transporters (major facilitator superfamily) [Phialocephala subalpina]|uniref:Related to synaptic vesicle transporter SVOP and related transporters (Major facilitator superfamily) n=1 Tax=Phialocephala subalpina TaxID=576137 RepID=A0A1L7XHI9_9HELO|nr:related to synaptic vesicle transporter SVOP and related transporters (major facilitator superfamily) [Phialocephala subalpina]